MLSDCFAQKSLWVGFPIFVVSYFYIGAQFYQNDESISDDKT